MPSNYTGNPAATQSPGGVPTLGVMPIAALPVDTDTPNSSSIYQPLKEAMDWIGMLSQWGAAFMGVTLWNSSTTYPACSMVYNPHDANTWRVKLTKTSTPGTTPDLDTANWEQWAFTPTSLAAMLNGVGSPYYEGSTGGANFWWPLPGNAGLQWEALSATSGTLPTSGSMTHTWAHAYSTRVDLVAFWPTSLSEGHSLGMPTIIAGAQTLTTCQLVLVGQGASANGYVESGYLFSIGK